jgi:hypothetical protein
MPKKKVLKNPQYPKGRKEWEGRTPTYRTRLNMVQLAIIKEVFEDYFLKYPQRRIDPEYSALYERILEGMKQIETPLMEYKEEGEIWDKDYDLE